MTKQEAERPRRTLPEVLTDIVQQQAPTDCNYTIVILCGAILIADNRDRKRSRCVFLSFPHSSPRLRTEQSEQRFAFWISTLSKRLCIDFSHYISK